MSATQRRCTTVRQVLILWSIEELDIASVDTRPSLLSVV